MTPAEKRLREALDVIANASERSETMFGGKMSEVTRVFEHITRVSRTALAALDRPTVKAEESVKKTSSGLCSCGHAASQPGRLCNCGLFIAKAEAEESSASPREHELREALQRMEWACEQLAATRPQAAYDAMIDGGQAQALLELDNARRAARDLLRTPAQSGTNLCRQDVESVRNWLSEMPSLDMEDVVADGGITAWMVVQQEAREMAGRLDRALAEARGDQPEGGR